VDFGGFLINPYVVDARTGVTTQLLSDEGFVVTTTDDDGNELEEAFAGRDFEKKFFAEPTNRAFCKTLLEHGLRDPISGEFGKTIAFAVSQNHTAKIVQILNEMADQLWPGRYKSDFAMQVTSHVADAQRMTVNFANNNLGWHSDFAANYRTICAVKFVDRPFAQGADGIKILRTRQGLLPKYLVLYLQAYPLAQDGYPRRRGDGQPRACQLHVRRRPSLLPEL
jgi:hypothetical protein